MADKYFSDDIRRFVARQGFSPVFYDYKPADPDNLVAIMVYHILPSTDGSLQRATQIQVRNTDAKEAYRIAMELAKILDSGSEETVIWLSRRRKRWAICTPTAGVRLLEHDDRGRSTYYFEVSIWGDGGL